jgi:hypothetical protein
VASVIEYMRDADPERERRTPGGRGRGGGATSTGGPMFDWLWKPVGNLDLPELLDQIGGLEPLGAVRAVHLMDVRKQAGNRGVASILIPGFLSRACRSRANARRCKHCVNEKGPVSGPFRVGGAWLEHATSCL